MTSKIRDQILAIRDTGLTNMFDKNMVQRLAYDREMYELVMFLEEDIKEYVKFIMYGDNLPACPPQVTPQVIPQDDGECGYQPRMIPYPARERYGKG